MEFRPARGRAWEWQRGRGAWKGTRSRYGSPLGMHALTTLAQHTARAGLGPLRHGRIQFAGCMITWASVRACAGSVIAASASVKAQSCAITRAMIPPSRTCENKVADGVCCMREKGRARWHARPAKGACLKEAGSPHQGSRCEQAQRGTGSSYRRWRMCLCQHFVASHSRRHLDVLLTSAPAVLQAWGPKCSMVGHEEQLSAGRRASKAAGAITRHSRSCQLTHTSRMRARQPPHACPALPPPPAAHGKSACCSSAVSSGSPNSRFMF
jgi:hypothetical protein